MKSEMRQKLADEPFPEKIRKVAQLVQMAKAFPRDPDAMPKHIRKRAGTWDGDISGEELLRKTRP